MSNAIGEYSFGGVHIIVKDNQVLIDTPENFKVQHLVNGTPIQMVEKERKSIKPSSL